MNSVVNQKQNLERITNAIQNFFEIGGELSEDAIEDLHSQFVELVESSNQRLKKCDELLRSGLRGEAIQEAELEPNLFEMVAELDIPSWDAWRAYVIENGFSPQPDLLVDVAAALNEAYTANQPLEKLLRRHRAYALARGALEERIKILRAIANADNDNQVWKEDLASYEKARHGEIEKEFKQYAYDSNFPRIKQLHQEVNEPVWLIAPSGELVGKIDKEYCRLISVNATNRLIELEKAINHAFSEFNFDSAISLRDQWGKFEPQSQESEKANLVDLIGPAFEWMDDEIEQREQEAQKRKAFARLDAALNDDGVKKVELQNLMNVAQRFEDAISSRLENRYNEKIRSLETREKRRTIALTLTLVATILVFGGLVGLGILINGRNAAFASARAQMSSFLEAGQLNEAEAFLNSQPSRILDTPEFSSFEAKLEELQSAEASLVSSFNGLLDLVKSSSD